MGFKSLSSEYLIRHQYFTARKDTYQRPDGLVVDPYFVVELPVSVAVAGITEAREVVMIRQFRYPVNETLIELSDEEFAPVRKLQKVADLLELAANTRNAETVKEWLFKLAIEWNNSHAAAEQERLEIQFRAIDNKLANLRMMYNKRNEHPAPDSEFWNLVDQFRELKKRLGK